ncbi:MAG: hypothetical protein WAO83_25735 [Fuerstiella sp.]|jgi:hypothetical protein
MFKNMSKTVLGGMLAMAIAFAAPSSAEAGHARFVRPSPRTINSYHRDVRQFQRQSTRSFNQFDRNVRRTFYGPAPVRYAPRSSGLYLGGQRGGVFIRF